MKRQSWLRRPKSMSAVFVAIFKRRQGRAPESMRRSSPARFPMAIQTICIRLLVLQSMTFPLALHSRLLLTLRTRALPRFLCSSHSHHVSHARMLVAPAIPILLIRLALVLLGLVRLLLTLRLSILPMARAKRICRVYLLSRSVTPMSSFQAVEQSETI